jgi:hypothetical protein
MDFVSIATTRGDPRSARVSSRAESISRSSRGPSQSGLGTLTGAPRER